MGVLYPLRGIKLAAENVTQEGKGESTLLLLLSAGCLRVLLAGRCRGGQVT